VYFLIEGSIKQGVNIKLENWVNKTDRKNPKDNQKKRHGEETKYGPDMTRMGVRRSVTTDMVGV
jgi:hypothetical protein